MDPITYYSTTNIQMCALKAGYKAEFGLDPVKKTTSLYIPFTSHTPQQKSYWRWYEFPWKWADIDTEEQEVI